MVVCFFKQKTAYEMRISDWSSDVCSSDLPKGAFDFEEFSSYFPITVICTLIGAPADTIPSLRSSLEAVGLSASMQREHVPALQAGFIEIDGFEIGRASCRERVCQYVEVSVVAVSLKKKITKTIKMY